MTKDNWIKAFDEKFKGNLYCEQPSKNRMYHYESRTDWTPPESWEEGVFIKTDEAVKKFISQVEKDAIEKTNKRWRKQLGKVLSWDFNGRMMTSQEKHKQISDLLEDKYEG